MGTTRAHDRSPADPAHEVEVEWQFDALDLRPVERWLAALATRSADAEDLEALHAAAKPGRRQVDRYLDTADWRIGRAGFVLRLRRRGRRDEVTLKDNRPAGAGGLRRRFEATEDVPEAGLEALGVEGPVGRRLAAVAGQRPLLDVVEIRTRRRPYALQVGAEDVAEIALDDTQIVLGDGQRPAQMRRVEVEVIPAWVDALEPVVDELRAACGLQPASLSKFEAGLLALGVNVPGAPDLGPTDVHPGSTLGELAYAVLRRHLGALLAHEPGTRLGEDPEELHDMRVATRRLRAAIDLFSSVLPARAATLRAELGWLASALGVVRDLDVQILRMEDFEAWSAGLSTAGGDAQPIDELGALLERERVEGRDQLLEALESARWERLAAGLTTLARQGPSRRSVAARRPAVLVVPDLIEERHRAVRRAARRAKHSGVAADFHRLRIRDKRLRYALEFSADLYGRRTEPFVRQLTRLQDRLGLLQDAEVAVARMTALVERPTDPLPPATVFAMGAIAERYREEAARLLDGLPKLLKVVSDDEWRQLETLMRRRALAVGTLTPRPVAPGAGAPARPGPYRVLAANVGVTSSGGPSAPGPAPSANGNGANDAPPAGAAG